MSKFVLVFIVLLVLLAVPAYGQVIINEFNTGTPDFWELKNVGTAPVDISGWRVDTWYALSAVVPSVDTSFTMPAGTILPPDGFVVGQDSSSGTGPTIFYVGANLFWTSSRTTEIALFDATGAGVDYVYADYWGFGPSPNLPTGTNWIGNYVPGTGNDGNYRTTNIDTDNATDWTSGSSKTPNANNPGQGPQPPVTGLVINEFYTGAIPAVEIFNSNAATVDVSGFILSSWTDTGSGLVADPTFTVPAGTTIAPSGFLVLEAGGTAGAPGTYPSSMATGNAYGWSGTMTIELALQDNQGVYVQGVDYVIYDHFGTIAGAGPNLPSPTLWTGDFDMGTGDTHERVSVGDTNSAADWAKNTNAHSLGTYNPPQVSGVSGIVFNEFNTDNPDYLELLNTTSAPVDVTGYVIDTYYLSGTTWYSNGATLAIPTIPAIPAGGVVCLVEAGTAGTAGPYPNSYYTGSSWAWVPGDEFEAVLYGPLGILPLDYFLSGQGVNPQTYPSNHKPGTLVFDGTQNCVNELSADIIERLTVVDRDNAGDWVRQGTGMGTTPGALNPVQSLPCNGYFSQYGTGCVSTNGSPVLMGTGCPTPGGSLTVELVYAPTGATSMIVLGLGNLSLPISACCAVQVAPIVQPQIFLVMPATYLTVPATIPASLPTPVDAYMQVLFGDTANPCGISASNPLQIHFQ